MDASVLISLLTLIALEVVLGIDNIIFISILAGNFRLISKKKPETGVFCWPWLCAWVYLPPFP